MTITAKKTKLNLQNKHKTQQSLNRVFWSVCDILRRSNCAGVMQYIPELSWLLFLRMLDEQEIDDTETIKSPYRWKDWASPKGSKRIELEQSSEHLLDFVKNDLFPYFKKVSETKNIPLKFKVVSEVVSRLNTTKIDTEENLTSILDRVDKITTEKIDKTHVFPISQVYEGLLLKMGEKANDGGQFFTPREVIRMMIKVINPQINETVYDPCCGTGGFLAQTYEYIRESNEINKDKLKIIKEKTFFGREKENLIFPIALANLVLHGIDYPQIWHGNTLTRNENYGEFFSKNFKSKFDVILSNPPFGGKEGDEAKTFFDFKSGATQVLFLQHIIESLKKGGRCAVIVDEGILFRNSDNAFLNLKKRLLAECDLWCILSLPIGAFAGAGAGVKTNVLFFTKGKPTENIWYYDLSDLKLGKKTPMTAKHFADFLNLLPEKPDSQRSWTVSKKKSENRNYDLKAANPNIKFFENTLSKPEIISLINKNNKQINKLTSKLSAGDF